MVKMGRYYISFRAKFFLPYLDTITLALLVVFVGKYPLYYPKKGILTAPIFYSLLLFL